MSSSEPRCGSTVASADAARAFAAAADAFADGDGSAWTAVAAWTLAADVGSTFARTGEDISGVARSGVVVETWLGCSLAGSPLERTKNHAPPTTAAAAMNSAIRELPEECLPFGSDAAARRESAAVDDLLGSVGASSHFSSSLSESIGGRETGCTTPGEASQSSSPSTDGGLDIGFEFNASGAGDDRGGTDDDRAGTDGDGIPIKVPPLRGAGARDEGADAVPEAGGDSLAPGAGIPINVGCFGG